MSESDMHEEEVEYVEEEITCEEVDQVLARLSQLMETVESDTILEYLDETYNQIFSLVYEEVEEDATEDVAELDDQAEAA